MTGKKCPLCGLYFSEHVSPCHIPRGIFGELSDEMDFEIHQEDDDGNFDLEVL